MHCPAKGRAGGSRSRLQVLLACSCALVVVIYAPRRRRTAVLNHSGQGDGDGSSSGAGDSGSGGGGTAGGTGGGSSGGDCKLDRLIGEGPFAQSCHLIKDVCVDQRTAILYSSKYHPAPGRHAEALPVLEPPKRHRHYIFVHKETNEKDYNYGLPAIRFRPSSVDEAPAYLADPVFSECTVPIVYYSHYLVNVAHAFRDNAARLYGALKETPWAAHAKLVLMTPEGLAPPSFSFDLMRPLTGLEIETWADFTTRLPSQKAPGGGGSLPKAYEPPAPGALPLSAEGGPQRCFRHMYVCMDNLNITGWPLHAYGQHLVQHYWDQLPPEAAAAAAAAGATGGRPGEAMQRRLAPPSMAAGGKAAAGGAAASSSGSSRGGVEPVINIVFHKRSAPERQLINTEELLQRCNAWRYTTQYGLEVRAKCWEVELPDLLTGIAAAQQADIFVGAHGANLANAWLMRPGSSVIELTMFQFDETDAHMNLAKRNLFDNDTEVQWWKILLCDPHSWTPGLLEKAGLAEGEPYKDYWPKYRNLILRWEALEAAFQAVVDTGGDMAAYRQRWKEGEWWWLSTASQTMYAGKSVYQTCKKAQAAGLISS